MTARLWDAATGKPLDEPLKHDNSVNAVVFSPDGTKIATASGRFFDKGGEAWVWDVATAKVRDGAQEVAVSVTIFKRSSSRVILFPVMVSKAAE